MTDLKIVDIEDKILDEKIEKYLYWLTTYGHEAASMWCMDNLTSHEIPEFKRRIQKNIGKYGLK